MKANKTYTLITGASSGIGLALAREYARNKHNLILVARNQEALKTIAKELTLEYKISTDTFALDLTNINNIELLLGFIKKKKYIIDNIINNAGFGLNGQFCDLNLQDQIDMINLNVTSVVKLCHHFANLMKKQSYTGHILNVASTAAFQPGPYMSIYYATKAFLLSFSNALNKELQSYNISVGCLCPGPTKTNFDKVANTTTLPLFNNPFVMTSEEVARIAYKQINKNKMTIIPGLSNKIVSLNYRFLPRQVLLNIVSKIQKPNQSS
jgi:uncharacterized protein